MHTLERVPNSWTNDQHEPRFGAFEGAFSEVNLTDWDAVQSLPWLRRKMRHKRWFYASVATPEVFLASAMVNAGIASSMFIYAVDLAREELLFEQRYMGGPGPTVSLNNKPGAGFKSRALLPGVSARCVRHAEIDPYSLNINAFSVRNWKGQRLQARLNLHAAPTTSGDALSLLAPVGGDGRVNFTQKWVGLQADGELKIGGRVFDLAGGQGGMDYTSGILDRRTCWRWAMGHGRDVDGRRFGFNLVEGFNEDAQGTGENGLWVDGRLWPLPRVRFSFDARDHSAPWHLHSDDGSVNLTFRAIHVHREPFALGNLVRSHFVQPAGFFDGEISISGGPQLKIHHLPGVTEDQDMLW
jgi:hypothetical protein